MSRISSPKARLIRPLNFWRYLFRDANAFSLVEVTLALGIVAFSLVTLLGVMPMGLATFHKAVETSVSSQIVQQVVSDVEQTDFSTLTASSTGVTQLGLRYFDDQGNELSSATSPGAIYQVNVVINTSPVLSGGSTTAAPSLACLTIDIVANPGNAALTYNTGSLTVIPDPTHGIYVSRYSAYVAKNQ
jgi:uncharacterized protein (TIGR02598 family)